jgi:hypothetical protein
MSVDNSYKQEEVSPMLLLASYVPILTIVELYATLSRYLHSFMSTTSMYLSPKTLASGVSVAMKCSEANIKWSSSAKILSVLFCRRVCCVVFYLLLLSCRGHLIYGHNQGLFT